MMLKKLFCLIFLVTFANANAFKNEESALNFAWDYANKNLYHGDNGFRVGILMSEIDTIINEELVFFDPENIYSIFDTIPVPTNHFVIGIERNDMISGGCQPYTLIFASKIDSSYKIVDACGHFIDGYKCNIPYRKMFTRQNAIDTLKANLNDLIGNKNANVYLSIEKNESSFITSNWNFLIESKSDTILVSYIKEMLDNDNPFVIIEHGGTYDVENFEYLYSYQSDDVKNLASKKSNLVFPNPVSDEINVLIETSCTLSLFSCDGKLIKKEKGSSMKVSEIPSGMYQIMISKDGESIIETILKK